MLNLKNVYKKFRTDDIETSALNDINLTIEKGEFIAIMGPSGCGKSTLLNTIGMLDNPSSGEYVFLEEDVANYKEKALNKIRKMNIGFIFQNFNLINELTVCENIEMALIYHRVSANERNQRVVHVMDRLGIAHRAKHFPTQLSGGQQQRVAIARAVIGNQKMILADEPTGNLDSVHGQEVMEILQSLNRDGVTIVMVTHSQSHANYASRIVHLFDGSIVSENIRAA